MTFEVISDWAGQDRPYAVLDLLSAARCRIRRQLFKERDVRRRTVALTPEMPQASSTSSESALEELTRSLVALHRSGAHRDDVAVVYAQHVLGYSISEFGGRDRTGPSGPLCPARPRAAPTVRVGPRTGARHPMPMVTRWMFAMVVTAIITPAVVDATGRTGGSSLPCHSR